MRPLIAQDLPSPTQNAVAGAEVFGEKGCIRCHSISGGGQSLGPDLRAVGSTRTFQDLTAALWNHLPDMNRRMADLAIERPHLSAREAGDLFAYLYTLGYFGGGGDAERGERLFTDLSCIRCHQIGGVGGVVGRVSIEEDTQGCNTLVPQLGRDLRFRCLDLVKAREPVVVQRLRLLGQIGVGPDVMAVDRVSIGQVADAGARTHMLGIGLEHRQPVFERRLD